MDTDPLLLLHVAEDTDLLLPLLVAEDTDLLLPLFVAEDTDLLPLLHTVPAEDTETDITVTDLLLIVAEGVLPLSVQHLS